MEVLSLIRAKECDKPSLTFHWKTKLIRLTHLCFADDLILFFHGDIRSVSILKGCLDNFSSISGLHLNAAKSMCFLSNSPLVTAEAILSSLGFQVGLFPAKFLGVPLITSKLSLADCRPLLERIVARISSWTNKFLSYSGRL